jgi:hypothetical protein
MTKTAAWPFDLGNRCYHRHCFVKAPMRSGSKILFIGHAPPPRSQWRSSAHGGGNATINHLSNFWRSEAFASQLAARGLGPETRNSDVSLDVVNIVPVISVGTKPIGKPSGTCLRTYLTTQRLRDKNMRWIRALVEHGGHNMIIVGWGRVRGDRSKLAGEFLQVLQENALERTIVYCSVEIENPRDATTLRYAGHPHGGFNKGKAAQPLPDFLA